MQGEIVARLARCAQRPTHRGGGATRGTLWPDQAHKRCLQGPRKFVSHCVSLVGLDMTHFDRVGHYRTNQNGTTFWVRPHGVSRDDWSKLQNAAYVVSATRPGRPGLLAALRNDLRERIREAPLPQCASAPPRGHCAAGLGKRQTRTRSQRRHAAAAVGRVCRPTPYRAELQSVLPSL